MPNGNVHKTAGAILGTSAYLLIKDNLHEGENIDLGELVLSTITGIGSARVPDILEPATNPNHRAFFHSFVFGFLLCYFGVRTWKDLQLKREKRKLLGIKEAGLSEILDIILIVGIGSVLLHLLMDGFTKKGLPFA